MTPMSALIDRLAAAGERRRAAAAAGEGGDGWAAATDFAATLEVLRADHLGATGDAGAGDGADATGDAGAGAAAGGTPLGAVAEAFGLDRTDALLLWIAAAGDLDANAALAYGQLRGLTGAARPSVALALELAGVPTAGAGPAARLGARAPLLRHRLLEIPDAEPWLARTLRVPDPVVAVLAGGAAGDPVVARLRTELVPVEVPETATVARAIAQGAPLVWVRSAAGRSGPAVAAGAFTALGVGYLALDLHRHPGGQGLSDAVAAGAREAGLRGCGLVVVGCDTVADGAAFEILENAAVPVVAVGTTPWNPVWLPRFPLSVDAGPLSVRHRAAAWRAGLGGVVDDDPELRETLAGLRLPAEDIAEAARYAHALAAARDVPLGADVVREAARRVGGSGGANSDRVTELTGARGPRFADLVLPEHVTGSLHRLVNWARHRDAVAAEGVLRGRGRGIAALFTGNPGTGKTLAAHVIAEELSIELFQVDLSAIVDKYIGETEKNLERVFQAAEALDVVLFFDEADALFGSRSEVRDARDRYANQEVAYLLQRMEHYDGITVLSTNLRGNLDRAFSRRMSFIVHFPDPDAPTRARLWQRHLDHLDQLGTLDAADPVDVEQLSAAVELAGGDIRNIVLAAAYDAAAAGEPIGMRHVLAATVGEYRKLGRVVPPLDADRGRPSRRGQKAQSALYRE